MQFILRETIREKTIVFPVIFSNGFLMQYGISVYIGSYGGSTSFSKHYIKIPSVIVSPIDNASSYRVYHVDKTLFGVASLSTNRFRWISLGV